MTRFDSLMGVYLAGLAMSCSPKTDAEWCAESPYLVEIGDAPRRAMGTGYVVVEQGAECPAVADVADLTYRTCCPAWDFDELVCSFIERQEDVVWSGHAYVDPEYAGGPYESTDRFSGLPRGAHPRSLMATTRS
jgi:hypothetical protein